MKTAAARRAPAPLYVLTALVCLVLSAPLTLAGVPAHAAPLADSSDFQFKITSEIVINKDDTYSVKMVMLDGSGSDVLTEKNCSNSPSSGERVKNAKATFKDEGNLRSCTIEGSQSIKDSKGRVSHEGKEYVVKIGSESEDPATGSVDVSQSVTFPGKITEADGGEVSGNKVTFNDFKAHTIKGQDGSIPTWVWILVGVLAVAVIGGVVAAIVITQRKKKGQFQPSPYAAPVQGYDPNQAFPAQHGYGTPQAQPGQQPYGAPQAQPGYGTPQTQSLQPPYGGPQAQPGYGTPQAQPGQQPYGAPQAQPGYGTPQAQTPPTQSLQPPYGGPQSGQSAY